MSQLLINKKQVSAYINGDNTRCVKNVFGSSIEEILKDCTKKFKLSNPAKYLFTVDGTPVSIFLVCLFLNKTKYICRPDTNRIFDVSMNTFFIASVPLFIISGMILIA